MRGKDWSHPLARKATVTRGFPFLAGLFSAPPVACSAFSLLSSSQQKKNSDPAAIKHG